MTGRNTIRLDDGSLLSEFDKSVDNIINRTIVLFGKRNSGKTVMLLDLAAICSEKIPSVFVICPTSGSSGTFKDKLPGRCIKTTITKNWLVSLFNAQKSRTEFYKKVNDPDVLKSLLQKINDPGAMRTLGELESKYHTYSRRIHDNKRLSRTARDKMLQDIKNNKEACIKEFYKIVLDKNAGKVRELSGMGRLSKIENATFVHRNLNINLLLIFDDCAAEFKKWCKESEIIKRMFYEGRWYKMTIIMTAQSDKELHTEYRTNTDIGIYTHDGSANITFGNRTSDGISKHVKTRAAHCIKAIFSSGIDSREHMKLIYSRMGGEPFFHMTAELHGEFRLGGSPLWNLSDSIEKRIPTNTESDGFFEKYFSMTKI